MYQLGGVRVSIRGCPFTTALNLNCITVSLNKPFLV